MHFKIESIALLGNIMGLHFIILTKNGLLCIEHPCMWIGVCHTAYFFLKIDLIAKRGLRLLRLNRTGLILIVH